MPEVFDAVRPCIRGAVPDARLPIQPERVRDGEDWCAASGSRHGCAHRAHQLQQSRQKVAAPARLFPRDAEHKHPEKDDRRDDERPAPGPVRCTVQRGVDPQREDADRRRRAKCEGPDPDWCAQAGEAVQQVSQPGASGRARKDQRGKRGSEGARDPQNHRLAARQDRQTPRAPRECEGQQDEGRGLSHPPCPRHTSGGAVAVTAAPPES
jgi:hypothetical protein